MKNFIKEPAMKTALLLAFAFLTGCSNSPPSSGGTTTSPSTGGGINNSVAAGTPIYLTLSSKWEGSSTYSLVSTCATSPTAIDPSVTNCSMSIEEARMFFSDVRFTVGTMKSNLCEVIAFKPYYYMRSNSATYTRLGTTAAIDCSGATIAPVADCYGGAAPIIMGSSFPTYTGKYFLSVNSTSQDFDVASENSLQKYGSKVNYLLTNDLADRISTVSMTSASQEHVGGSMKDYAVLCMDRWGTIHHQINLILHDQDGSGSDSDPTQDEFPDWQ